MQRNDLDLPGVVSIELSLINDMDWAKIRITTEPGSFAQRFFRSQMFRYPMDAKSYSSEASVIFEFALAPMGPFDIGGKKK